MPFLPPLLARDPGEHHRASTPLELFFDLVSVISIASITAALHHAISHGHGVAALGNFAFLFIAIWWVWMNFTWFASAFDHDDPLYRLLVLILMSGSLIFAGGAGHIFETMDFSWGLAGWILMRLSMAALWLRASGDPRHRRTARFYAIGIVIAQLAWTLLYFIVPPGGAAFFIGGGICFVIEALVPLIAERAGVTPWHRHHIIERYGLLTIIVLGELLLSISLGFGMLYGEKAHPAAAASSAAGILIVFCLWWLYFAEGEHLTETRYSRAFIWGYGHVFFFASIAVLGAGIAAELDLASHHSEASQSTISGFIGGALAVGLFTLWAIRDRYHKLGGRSLSLPVMAAVFIAGAACALPSWGFAILSVVTLLWRIPMTNSAGIT